MSQESSTAQELNGAEVSRPPEKRPRLELVSSESETAKSYIEQNSKEAGSRIDLFAHVAGETEITSQAAEITAHTHEELSIIAKAAEQEIDQIVDGGVKIEPIRVISIGETLPKDSEKIEPIKIISLGEEAVDDSQKVEAPDEEIQAEVSNNKNEFANGATMGTSEEVMATLESEVDVTDEAKKKTQEESETPESAEIKNLRAEASEIDREMNQAKLNGQSEVYDKKLLELLATKRNLSKIFQMMSNLGERQRREVERLSLEIAALENEKEIRTGMSELRKLEEEKKVIEAEIITLADSHDPERLANANERLSEINKKLAEKKGRINTLHGQQASYDYMLESVKATEMPGAVDAGKTIENVVAAVGEGIIDPGKVALKALDRIIGDTKASG